MPIEFPTLSPLNSDNKNALLGKLLSRFGGDAENSDNESALLRKILARANLASGASFFSPSEFGAVGDGSHDDIIAIQSAADAAMAVSGVLMLDAKKYAISAPLVLDRGVTVMGSGVVTHNGRAADNPGGSINIPVESPYLSGSVLLMTTAGANVIEITAVGETVNLHDFGIQFVDAIKFENTGHGIYQMPPDNVIDGVGTFKDNGPQNSNWTDIYVYGCDGDHYAFYSCNSLYSVHTNIASAGGGGWCHENNGYVTGDVDDYNQLTGNVVLTNASFFTFSGGTAHCVHVKRTAGNPSHVTMIRPQGLSLNAASYGASTQPTDAQKLLKVDYASNFIQIYQPAWENLRSGTASKVDIGAQMPGFFMTTASSVGDQPIAERGVDQGAGALPNLTSSPISWGSMGWSHDQRILRFNEPLDGNNWRRGFYVPSPDGAVDHIGGWYVTDYGDSTDYHKWGVGVLNTAGDTYTWNQWVSQRGNQWCAGWMDGGSRYYKELASNQSVTTTTLTNATGMSFTLPAGTFELTGLWTFSNSASGTGAKLQVTFSQNISITWKLSAIPDSGAQTPTFNAFSSTSLGSINTNQSTAQYPVFELHRARITLPSSTTVTVQFSQQTADGGINTTMLAGSYVEARRLAGSGS